MAPRGNDLQCPHCPKTFITEALLGMHMESKHAPGSEQKVQAGRVDAKDQSVAHLMFTREGAMNQAAVCFFLIRAPLFWWWCSSLVFVPLCPCRNK